MKIKYFAWFAIIAVSVFIGSKKLTKTTNITSNPFENYKNELAKQDYNSHLISVQNSNFDFNSLPRDVQFELFKEKQRFYDRQNLVLKSFATRLNQARKSDPNISIDKLPPLISFLNTNISEAEVDKIFESEKSKHPPGTSSFQIRSQIKFEIISKSALDFYITNLNLLYNADQIKILSPAPAIPKEWLDTKDFPKLGDSEAPNKLIVFANYTCESCKNLNEQLSELYAKYGPNQLEITYIPYGSFVGAGEFLNKAAMCVFQKDVESFWKFHIGLVDKIKGLNISLIQEKDFKLSKQMALEQFSKIQISQSELDSCMSEKNTKLNELYEKTKSKFSYLEINDLPVFILNNSKLDLEGRSLLSAFNEKFK